MEDIWLYKFCIGEKVEQFHVEPNGTYSEEFRLGGSSQIENFEKASRLNALEDDVVLDDSELTQELILFNAIDRYMTIDKQSGGHIIRIFEKNITQPRHKHDMVGIFFP